MANDNGDERRNTGTDPGKSLDEALELHHAGRRQEARRIYAAILEQTPDHPEALHLFGLTAYQMGNLTEAARHIDAALRLRPSEAKILSNRGNVAKAQGHAEEAREFYERAIAADPAFPDARFNLGVLLLEGGRLAEAVEAFEALLARVPGHPDAANNLAMVRHRQGRLAEAAALLTGLVKSGAAGPETLLNLGSVHRSLGRPKEAEAAYRAALDQAPDLPGAWFNLGGLLEQRKRAGEAIEAYERAVSLDPSLAEASAALRHQLMHACAWPRLARLNAEIDDNAKRSSGDGRSAETPFANVVRCDDPARNLGVAQSWAAVTARRHPPLFDHADRRKKADGDRLVLGYLSSDICDHATAHLTRGLFAAHDRDRFQVNLYSYGPDDGSDYRRRIIADCDVFADIAEADIEAAARRIQADGVDILIDLKGWTQDNRLGICAHRPAPMQATYLGFPGSSGAAFLDYAVVDRIVVPPAEAQYFTEAPAYMPACYQINDDTQEIAAAVGDRGDWGLPEAAVVLCCFNQPYKITPEVFAVWMEVLRAVPGSVLWLLAGDPLAEDNLRAAAAGRGIAAERLVFAAKATKPAHLKRMQLADLALDTWIYNGHTTTSDALWAGLPVVARTGNHFASRVSTSCLTAVGLSELVTDSAETYRDLAVRLATRPDDIAALRARLWENRNRTPLFDTAGIVRALEDLYAAMWERFTQGLPPAPIG